MSEDSKGDKCGVGRETSGKASEEDRKTALHRLLKALSTLTESLEGLLRDGRQHAKGELSSTEFPRLLEKPGIYFWLIEPWK